MRYIRYALLALLAILLVSVALANRDPVTLEVFPDVLAAFFGVDWQITLPLFVTVLACVGVGLLIGFLWEWAREHKHRSEKARLREENARLRRDLNRAKSERDKNKDPVLTILDEAS